MKFKKLYGQGFQSYDKFEFNFPNGFVHIDGWNYDLDTANGVGKSALMNALCWCLYKKIPKKIKQGAIPNRYITCTPKVQVGLEMEIGDDTIEVVRSHGPNNLEITINGNAYTGGKPDEFLAELLNLSYEQFLQIVYIHQKSTGKFLDLNDTDKKQFLSTILSLEDFDKAYKFVGDELKSVKSAIDTTQGRISGLLESLNNLDGLISDANIEFNEYRTLAKLKEENKFKREGELEASLLGLEAEEDDYLAEIDLLKNELTIINGDILTISESMSKIDLEQTTSGKLNSYLKLKDEKTKELNTLSQELFDLTLGNKSPEFHGLRFSIKQHRETILDYESGNYIDTCHACGQKLVDFDPKAKLTKEKESLKELEKEYTRLESHSDSLKYNISKIENGLKKLDLLIEDERESCRREPMEKMKKLSGKLEALRAEKERKDRGVDIVEKTIKALHTKRDKLLEEIKSFDAEIANIKKMLDEKQSNLDKLIKKRDTTNDSIVEAKKQLEQFEEKISKLETLKHVFSPTGVKGYVFESLVGEINSRVNYYLSSLFDGIMRFEFQTSSEDSKGNIKQKFNEVISYNGEEIERGTLSGGEDKRLELAVDLAISDTISRRNSIFPSVMFIDEQMGGLDDAGAEKAYGLLAELASSSKSAIYLVDHATSMKGYFQGVVNIEKRNNISSITG